MYLERVSVKSWRALDDLELDLAPGLNLISGPNESGKSSLREALREAFLAPAGGGAASARPWSDPQACPEVQVDFVHQQEHWHLRRVFFGPGSRLERSGQVVALEDEVQVRLCEAGGPVAELWAVQGDVHLELPPSLRRRGAVSPGIAWLGETLDRRCAEGNVPGRRLADARAAVVAAEARLEEWQARLRELEAANHRLILLEGELQGLARLESEWTEERRECAAQVTSWERYRQVCAESEALEQELQGLEAWTERWESCRQELAAARRRSAEYRERIRSFQEELGPPADRTVLLRLNARLRCARACVGERLRAELAALRPPAPRDVARLEALLARRDAVEEAVRRLGSLSAAARQVQDLDAGLEQALREHRERSAEAQELQAQASELRQAAAAQARDLAQERARVQRGAEAWRRLRAVLLDDLWPRVQQHAADLEALRRQMGAEPDREALQGLAARQRYARALRRRLQEEELRTRRLPTPEQVEELRRLEARASRLAEAEGIVTLLEEEQARLAPLDEELLRAEQERARCAQAAAARTERREARRRESEERAARRRRLESGEERWNRERELASDLVARVAIFRGRKAQIEKALEPEPDRGPLEAATARREYARALCRERLEAEMAALNAPETADLAEMEELERAATLLERYPLRPGPVGATGPIAVGLAAAGLAVVVGPQGALNTPLAAGLAALLGAVAAGLGLSWVAARAAARSSLQEVRDLQERRTRLLERFGVASAEEARQRTVRAGQLREALEREPQTAPAAELRASCPDPESLEALPLAGLKEQQAALWREVGRLEAERAESMRRRDRHLRELELLLADHPEARYEAAAERLRALAAEFPDLALPSLEAADADLLRQGSATFRKALEEAATEPAGDPGDDALLVQAQRELEEAEQRRQELLKRKHEVAGRAEATRARLQECAGDLADAAVARAAAEARDELERLRRDLGVASLEEAVRREQEARLLQGRLEEAPVPESEFAGLRAECPEPETLEALPLEALPAELERIGAALEREEAAWQEARAAWEAGRAACEAQREKNPERLLEAHLDRIRQLGEEHPELGVPQSAEDEALIRFAQEDAPQAKVRQELERLAAEHDRLQETPVPAELLGQAEAAQAALEAARERLSAATAAREQHLGRFTAECQSYEGLLDPDTLPGFDAVRTPGDAAGQAEAASRRARELDGELEALFAELGAASLEEAREKAARGAVLRSLLEAQPEPGDGDPRAECADAEELDSLSLEALQQEVQSLPDRLAREEALISSRQQEFEARRQGYEALIQDNPEIVIPLLLQQFRTLASERPELGVPVPEQPSDEELEELQTGVGLGAVVERVRRLREALADQRAAALRPDEGEGTAWERVALAEARLRLMEEQKRERQDERQRVLGTVEGQGSLFRERTLAEEALQAARKACAEAERRAEEARLLRQVFQHAKAELEHGLAGPLRERLDRRLEELSAGRYGGVRLAETGPADEAVLWNGDTAPVADLSWGTKEQLAFLARLCLGELLSERERHVVIFDDSLVHTDSVRMEQACRLLQQAAGSVQIVLMTCHPERYAPLAEHARQHDLGVRVETVSPPTAPPPGAASDWPGNPPSRSPSPASATRWSGP